MAHTFKRTHDERHASRVVAKVERSIAKLRNQVVAIIGPARTFRIGSFKSDNKGSVQCRERPPADYCNLQKREISGHPDPSKCRTDGLPSPRRDGGELW